jgi:CheY-like chemotaxis protein
MNPNPIRVMIVDDNKDAADLQAAVVRSMGHEAEVEYTSAGAIKLASSFAARLFLLDLALPDMDGYELVRRLRPLAQAGARFVALSGYAPSTGGSLADKLFDEYVVKPMTPERLSDLLWRLGTSATS